MYAWTALWVFGGLFTIVAFLSSSQGDGLQLILGTVGLAALFGTCGFLLSVIYLASQLSVEPRDRRLIVRSWVKVGPLGTDREIDLSRASRALLLRPNFVEFEIPGATTRVWSMYRTIPDRDRFGTMWWFDEDYEQLGAHLAQLGVPAEYRRIGGLNSLIGWVTSH